MKTSILCHDFWLEFPLKSWLWEWPGVASTPNSGRGLGWGVEFAALAAAALGLAHASPLERSLKIQSCYCSCSQPFSVRTSVWRREGLSLLHNTGICGAFLGCYLLNKRNIPPAYKCPFHCEQKYVWLIHFLFGSQSHICYTHFVQIAGYVLHSMNRCVFKFVRKLHFNAVC